MCGVFSPICLGNVQHELMEQTIHTNRTISDIPLESKMFITLITPKNVKHIKNTVEWRGFWKWIQAKENSLKHPCAGRLSHAWRRGGMSCVKKIVTCVKKSVTCVKKSVTSVKKSAMCLKKVLHV